MPKNWNRRFKHNRDKIKTGDIYELAEVVRNLAIREQREGPLDRREADVHAREEDPRVRADVRARDGRGRGRGVPRQTCIARGARAAATAPPRRPSAAQHPMAVVGLARRRRQWRTPWRPTAQGVRRAGGPPDARVVRSTRCARPCDRGRRRAARRASTRRRRARVGVAGGATRSASVRSALAAAPDGRRRSSSTTPRARSSTPALFARCARGARADADGAIAAAPVTDTIKEADADGRVIATLDRSRAVGGPDAAGLPRARRSSARSTSTTTCSPPPPTTPGSSRRAAATCASWRPRPSNSRSRTPDDLAARRAAAAQPDADRLPRPPAPRRAPSTTRRALLHPRQRRALPRGGRRARDRRARRRRAHLPLHAGARRLGAPVLAPLRGRRPRRLLRVRARARPTCGSGIEADFVPGARGPHGATCSRRATGTTSSARCTSSRDARRRHRRRLGHLAPRRVARARSGGATSRRSARPRARGLFDILAHPDLVKVWGARAAACPTATCAATTSWRSRGSPTSDVAVEVSTAGLRKPVGEIYPAPAFLEMCLEAGCAGRAVVRRARARAARLRLRATRSSCWTRSA